MRRNVIHLLLGLFFLAGLTACGEGEAPGNGGVNSISGRITLATTGAGVPQVELTLFGSGSGNTFTDASGFYSFPNLQDGTYNIVLSKTGYTFSPGTFVVTMKGTSVTNQNSVAYALEPQTVADLNSVGFAQ